MPAQQSPRISSTGRRCPDWASKRACRSYVAGSKTRHNAGRAFGLRMPGVNIPPNVGAAHRQRCLTALALFEEKPPWLISPEPCGGGDCGCQTTRSSPALQRLLWVIAALALAIAPHLPHLAPWVVLLATVGAAWRVTIEVRHSGSAAEMAACARRFRRAARRARDVSNAQRPRSRHGIAGGDGGHEAARDAHRARSHRDRLSVVLRPVRRHSSTTRNCCVCPTCSSRRGC